MEVTDQDFQFFPWNEIKSPPPLVWLSNENKTRKDNCPDKRWVNFSDDLEKAEKREVNYCFPFSLVDDKEKLLEMIWHLTEKDWITGAHIHDLITKTLGYPPFQSKGS